MLDKICLGIVCLKSVFSGIFSLEPFSESFFETVYWNLVLESLFVFLCLDEDGNEDVEALDRCHDDEHLKIIWRLEDDYNNS